MKSAVSVELRGNALRAVVLFFGAASIMFFTLLFYGIASSDAAAIYGSMALLVVLMPLAVGLLRGNSFDIFEPINVAAAAILFGTTLRAPYLIFSDSPRANFLMMQQQFPDVVDEIGWVAAGIFFLCVGYVVTTGRFALERTRFIGKYHISLARLQLALVVVALVSLAGIILYVLQFEVNLNDLAGASYKRVAEYVTDEGEIIYGAGLSNFFAQFAQFGLIIAVGGYFMGYIRPNFQFGIAISLLFLLSITVPFLGSSRTPIILMIFSICVMGYYFGRIRLPAVFLALAVIIALIVGMGALRTVNQNKVAWDAGVVDGLVGSGNGFDAVRTTAVIDRVPEVRDHLYGESYAAVATFFIPRAMWLEKPQTDMGGWVKKELFGKNVQNAGWPPGIVAEAYANFGYVGIPIVLFLIGAFIRFIYESCRPLLGISLPVTVIYSVIVYKIGFNLIELNFAQGIATALVLVLPLMVLFFLVRDPRVMRHRRGFQLA